MLDIKGVPGVVGRTLIRPPASRLGPATPEERSAIVQASPFSGVYDTVIDRKSAYEILEKRTEVKEKEDAKAEKEKAKKKVKAAKKKTARKSGRRKKTAGDHLMYEAKLVARQIARQHGRKILRGLLGSMTRR